ncbi:MAG TPA: hypothetical protein PK916_04515, partial [Bacteroidota bacterium]|nr:hypothetical protein [Bacteroidota bacterium]
HGKLLSVYEKRPAWPDAPKTRRWNSLTRRREDAKVEFAHSKARRNVYAGAMYVRIGRDFDPESTLYFLLSAH